jgi:hypothetical protein
MSVYADVRLRLSRNIARKTKVFEEVYTGRNVCPCLRRGRFLSLPARRPVRSGRTHGVIPISSPVVNSKRRWS